MIYIDSETKKMVNINAPYKGRSRLDTPEIRDAVGVISIEEDSPPLDYNPDFYDRKEDWEASTRPYIIYTYKDPVEISQLLLKKAKQVRQELVDQIVVTTTSGKEFDGDEDSQDRMSRAINALEPGETTLWILADNTVDPAVTREELREALRKAGEAQTAVWAAPYA